MKSERRRAKRAMRRAVAKIAGKRHADQLRSTANAARRSHDLCLCSDDERYYATQAEADNDRSPAKVCGDCGKKKLRINYLGEAPKSKDDRITVRKGSETK